MTVILYNRVSLAKTELHVVHLGSFYTYVKDTLSLWPVDKETGDRLSKIVDEACLLLADYNGRLAAELEDRTTISKMLASFIQLQKDKLTESEKKLEVSNGIFQK